MHMDRTFKLKMHMAYSAFRVVLLCSDVHTETGPAQFAEDTADSGLETIANEFWVWVFLGFF